MTGSPALLSTVAPEAESFDPEQLANLLWIERGRPGFSALILDHFKSQFQASLEHLHEAALAENRDQTGRVVHRLQGCAASFGATRLTALLRDLEAQLKSNPRTLNHDEIDQLRHAGTLAAACYSQWLSQ